MWLLRFLISEILGPSYIMIVWSTDQNMNIYEAINTQHSCIKKQLRNSQNFKSIPGSKKAWWEKHIKWPLRSQLAVALSQKRVAGFCLDFGSPRLKDADSGWGACLCVPISTQDCAGARRAPPAKENFKEDPCTYYACVYYTQSYPSPKKKKSKNLAVV